MLMNVIEIKRLGTRIEGSKEVNAIELIKEKREKKIKQYNPIEERN